MKTIATNKGGGLTPLPEDLDDVWFQHGQVRELMQERSDLLGQILEEAGPDRDMSKVTVIGGTLEQKVDVIQKLDRELNALHKRMPQPHPGHYTGGPTSGEGSFAHAIRKAGWDPVTKPRVTVPAASGLFLPGLSAAVTTSGDIEDYYPRRVSVPGLGADPRYLYPALNQVGLSPTDTSVAYVRETSRTLAATGDMTRAIDATSTKPESALTVELANADLKQVAHKVSGIPNIVARQRGIAQVIENDLRLGLSEALDAMVSSAITAATIPMGSAGTDIAQKIRYAMAEVEAAGYSPDTVALSPEEAVALDLILLETNNSTGTGPLFGLRPRVSKALTLAIVFDSTAFATLYASPIEVASFEENDGATNSTLMRAELNAVAVIDREAAACEVWGS